MIWQLLILQVGFFFLLLLALQKLFHGKMLGAIQHMQSLQQQNMKKEHDLKLYEEKVLRECEEKLKKLDEEIHHRRGEIEEEMKALRDGMLQKIEAEKQTILAEAHEKEKVLERRFAQETRREGELAACRLIETAFSEKMKEVLHQQLVEELLDSLPKMNLEKITMKDGAVQVRTAYRLSSAQKETLKSRLVSGLNSKSKPASFEIQENVDPSLVAGFVVFLDKMELDGSLKNKFEKHING